MNTCEESCDLCLTGHQLSVDLEVEGIIQGCPSGGLLLTSDIPHTVQQPPQLQQISSVISFIAHVMHTLLG